ncbi:hypothetical protein CANINC_001523 [Pichia inconspicua]|uniref:DMAP1-binding domain-containing protein n=1 Tax=Pichia inconspicua TaxID=52247 RepID=A0A4T0X527_9ASCO|nr:hypothetical protein CANINC_001523 [[Candida] inconspicua]
MDFTIPEGVSADLELMLTRLAKDYHDGYLTEKGYIKKRMELLGQKDSTSGSYVPNSANNDSVADTNYELSNSDFVSDDFHHGHATSQSIDGSSATNPVQFNEDLMMKYNKLYNHYDYNIRKELQKPLDPRDVTSHVDLNHDVDNLAMILRKRAKLSEKEPALLIVDEKGRESKIITWDKLYYKAEKIAKQIKNKAGLYPGDRVCLIYQNVEVIDFMVAFYGCLLSGVVAVPLSSSTSIPDLVKIMKDTQSHLTLMSDSVFKYFEKLQKQNKVPVWPKGMSAWKTSELGVYKPSKRDGDPPLKVSDLAYIDYSKTSSGEYKGVVISHRTIINQMQMLDKILSTSPDIKTPVVRSTIKPSHSRNTILSTLDVRTSIGLIVSILFSVYSGNLLIWMHSKIAEIPGLFANMLSTYRVSIILSDYHVLKTNAYNYQSFPQITRTFSKRKVDLSCVKWCLIDTFTVDCEFNEILSDRWFKPLGCNYSKRVVAPILSLSEHGGAIISVRDWYGHEEQLGCIFNKSSQLETLDEFGDNDSTDKLPEILIDQESLSTNSVKVINDSPPSCSASSDNDPNYVRVGAFGYPLPDATLALVNPETNILSGVLEVGEIWVDSNCVSGGYWGLPEDTEAIFQAQCSDYEGVLSLRFVRTGLLGFIYNGKIYVLGLYEDRINQRVTWYDQYLALSADTKTKERSAQSHSRQVSMGSDVESYYKNRRKNHVYNMEQIDLSQDLSNKYIYKYHYSHHLIKTLAKNLPFFKECAFFNLKVNKEFVPVAVMESDLSNNTTEAGQVELQSMINEAFGLLEKYHNVRLLFIVITKSGALSRSMKNGRMDIANTLTKRRFLEGRLPSVYVAFRPHNSLGSIYHGEDLTGGIWSPFSSETRKDMLSYATTQNSGLDKRSSSVDFRSNTKITDFKSLIDILEFRANRQPDELAYAQLEGLVIRESKQLTTWKKFESKVFSICTYILEKKVLVAGDVVILMYPLSEEYIACLFACWMAGFVVIPLPLLGKSPQEMNEDALMLFGILKEFKVKAIFGNNDTEACLKAKLVANKLKELCLKYKFEMPKLRNTTKHSKASSGGKSTYKKMQNYRNSNGSKSKSASSLIWIYCSPDNEKTSVKVSSSKLLAMCLSVKESCQMNGTVPLIGCSNFTSGLGFLMSSVMGVYLGATTYLMTEQEYKTHTSTFFQAIERYKIDNVFLESKLFIYALNKNALKNVSLKGLKNLMLSWSQSRADPLLAVKYKVQLDIANLKPKYISSILDHPLNPLISTRSYVSIDPVILWLDPHALSQGYISIVNPKDYPNAIPLVDSGTVCVNTEVLVVNPQTHELCRIGEFGEIWVLSDSTADGYAGSDNNKTNLEFLNGKLELNDQKYLRTGEFGFLHSISKTIDKKVIELQLVFVLGRIDETFDYCGLQFFASDFEHCIESFDGVDHSCVFKAGEYTTMIVSTSAKRSLSTITPLMTLKLLNKFKVLIDIISFVDFDTPPLREGRLQRATIASKWIQGKLRVKATFGVSYGENEMIKAIRMKEWTEDRISEL